MRKTGVDRIQRRNNERSKRSPILSRLKDPENDPLVAICNACKIAPDFQSIYAYLVNRVSNRLVGQQRTNGNEARRIFVLPCLTWQREIYPLPFRLDD